MERMIPVNVTVAMGARKVPLEQVSDSRIRSALEAAARDVAGKLGRVKCAEHKRGALNVRIHFDKNGAADLQYDSCCAKLGELIGKALG